jgi:hypothetical protein
MNKIAEFFLALGLLGAIIAAGIVLSFMWFI